MFCSNSIARGCCICCRLCPLEALLACRILKAKIKETVATCNYFCIRVAESKTCIVTARPLPPAHLSLHKGTSLGLVNIDWTLHTKLHSNGCTRHSSPPTVLTCVRIMLPSFWSQVGSLVLGILWVYVSLCASKPKGAGFSYLCWFHVSQESFYFLMY